MKRYLCLIAVALYLTAMAVNPTAAQDVAYSRILNDLPIMPGLAEDPDSLVIFDAPEGRIAEVTLSGNLSPTAVLDYYRSTLPELGWQAQSAKHYTRDGQTLSLRVEKGRFVFHLVPLSP